MYPRFVLAQKDADTVKLELKPEKNCYQQDLGDLLRKKDKKPKPPKNFWALILPNISSNPTNGFMLGITGAISWYMGPDSNTGVSSAPFTLSVTSKSQFLSYLKTNIYTKNNEYFLQGDWRFYIYSQPTYGLGTNAPDSVGVSHEFHWAGESVKNDSAAFPMKFNYLKIHEIVNKKIINYLYAGIGYHLDYYYAIDDEHLDLDTTPQLITPHYLYSQNNNFDTARYMLSGMSLNVVYDSRDNNINAYKGIYANINYRYNFTFLGSDQNASNLWVEFRTYLGISKKKARNLVALWTFGDFNLTGHMPYLTLPYLGEDQRARSGRGYTNGRFRGEQLIYAEAEWRFPISQCSEILGGVIFVNATTTTNKDRDVRLFQYIEPAVGFGLRLMVNKRFRTNINLDFAIGNKTTGLVLFRAGNILRPMWMTK